MVKILLALLGIPLLLVLGGCRLKSVESFRAATIPVDGTPWRGDPYAGGGIAFATGGLDPKTHYGEGARTDAALPANGYDRPAKGSGLQPGENPPSGEPWWATSNGPAMQPMPSDLDPNATRVRQ